jgi:peptidoglycan/xylan/chitin deacetylase (PgdA/CDA1 family)
MKRRHRSSLMAPPFLACAAAYLAAFILAFADPRLSIIPLAMFLALCLLAPFFPGLGFYLPVVSRGKSGKNTVALTFDDGPDPSVTPALLDLLQTHGAPATFFITGKRASEHRELVRRILAEGHSIGNHSYNHLPFLMLKSCALLKKEILSTQEALSEFGISPLVFRPPVGITSPRLGPALAGTGLQCVNFNCRGYDAGNRFISRLSSRILKKVEPDDIILLHDTAPAGNFSLNIFISEIDSILHGLKSKGISVAPLSEIIGVPVMKSLP